jgi:cytoskeletal protein CcmA (bactofilin family)
MAQIIKHRRGSIGSVKTTTARNAELIVASGSISDLSGPFVLIGSPTLTDEGVAGAHIAVSKIYTGTNAPTIATATYGSVLDGTPFYSTNDQALYVLGNAGGGGNTNMDLTGNLEGRSVTKLTIDQLNGSVNVTGSVIISQNISASGDISASNLELQGNANIKGNITLGGNINIGNQNTDLVVFAGEISSSILPELNNEFDLGSGTQAWRNLHVSGTANIQNINLKDVQIYNNITVSGSATFGTDSTDRLTATASVFISSSVELTGSLSQLGNTTQTGSLNVSGGVNVSAGDVRITDNLFVSGGTINVANTATDIEIKDNTATALTISEGSNNYVVLNTTNSSEKITLGNTSTQIDNVIVDGKANAFTIKEGANSYLDIATSNGSELITLGNTITSITNEVEDNAANAFKVAEGSNTYINVATTDSSEKVTIGNDLVSIDNVVEDNVANAFVVKEASNPYITIDTTNGSEKIKLQTAGNVEVSGITTIQNSTQNSTHTDGALVVTGGVGIGKNLYVSGSTTIAGNLTVLGSATQVIISASTVEIDDNILRLNAYSPFQRYAGIEVMDSGSNNVSASLLWDSTSDYWLFTSASGETGKAITTTFGTQGSEISLTINTVPKATGLNAIGNSLITDNGTSFAYNTDALIVTGSSGQTYIKGKVTLANAGGTDANSNSSAMIFRNSSNELGYVSTTATTDVLTGILGYKEVGGGLVFSSKIDGGFF